MAIARGKCIALRIIWQEWGGIMPLRLLSVYYQYTAHSFERATPEKSCLTSEKVCKYVLVFNFILNITDNKCI